jgi:hypothetical protein
MEAADMMRFSFHFFFMSYKYIILIFKHKKHSLKDLLNYTEPKGLIYCKIQCKLKIETT